MNDTYWTDDPQPMGCVYRAYDADGVLLYIGTTRDFEARRHEHMRNSIWRNQVARWRVRWYLRWLDAAAAEREAIATEHARWNVLHRGADHPDGVVRRVHEVVAMYPDGLARPVTGWMSNWFDRIGARETG